MATRGDDGICGGLFSYIDLEQRVRADHPLRLIRQIANAALHALSGEYAKLYSPIGRSRSRQSGCCGGNAVAHHSPPWSAPLASIEAMLTGEVGPRGSTEAARTAEAASAALDSAPQLDLGRCP